MGVVANLVVRVSANISDYEKQIASMEKQFARTGGKLQSLGRDLTAGISVPLAAIGGLAIKAAMDFESSFAGVKKTVQATDAEFKRMGEQFRNLAKEIPVNVNELNRLGEAAGALGIPKEEIVDFARVMALLGVTTNVTSDQAAESIAKIQNIFNAAGQDTDRFAATLVALGNDGASTESQILEMATRIAGAGNAIGLTQGEVLAFASALSSVGIEAEMGGSAISRVFIEIASAVSKGGDEIAGFAQVAGQPIAEFQKLFQEDAASAVNAFITGLGRIKTSGGDLIGTLEALGFSEIRVRDTLLRTAGAGDLLTRALNLQQTAWRENSALTDEARKRFETFESKLKTLWNQINDVAIVFGNALLPTLTRVVDKMPALIDFVSRMAEKFAALPAPVQDTAIAIGALAIAAGPLTFVAGTILKAGGAILGLGRALGSLPGWVVAMAQRGGSIAGTGAGLVAGFGVGNSQMTRGWDDLARGLMPRMPSSPDLFKNQPLGALNIADPNGVGFVAGGVVEGLDRIQESLNAPGLAAESPLSKALKSLQDRMASVSTEARAWVKHVADMGGVTELTAKKKADLHQALQNVIDEYGSLKEAGLGSLQALFEATTPVLEATRSFAGMSLMPAGGAGLDESIHWLQAWGADASATAEDVERLQRAGLHASAVLGTVGVTIGSLAPAMEPTTDGIREFREELERVPTIGERIGGALGLASQIVTQIGGDFGRAASTITVATRDIWNSLQQDENGRRDWGGAIGAGASALASVTSGQSAVGGAARGAAIGSVAGPWGAAIGAGIGAIWGAMAGQREHRRTNDVRDQFLEAAGGLQAFHQQIVATLGPQGEFLTQQILQARTQEQFNAAVQASTDAMAFQEASMETLRSAVERYGFTVEESGAAMQRLTLGDQAAQLFQDWTVLNAAQIDNVAILDRMSGAVNEYVAAALRTGTEIPAAMQPMLQKFVDAGLLLDQNGNAITDLNTSGITFSETMTQGFTRVVQSVQMLTQAIAQGLGIQLPAAANAGVDGINAAFSRIQPVDLGVIDVSLGDRPFVEAKPGPEGAAMGGFVTASGVQHFALGGWAKPRGTDTVPAMLTPGEFVANEDQQEQLVRALNGESRPIVVSVQVDGKEIARAANNGYEQGGEAWAMLERMVRQMVPA